MDLGVVLYGNCLRTPDGPKVPLAQLWLSVLKGCRCLPLKKQQWKASSPLSRELISHSCPLCMNVNGCSESMQNRIKKFWILRPYQHSREEDWKPQCAAKTSNFERDFLKKKKLILKARDERWCFLSSWSAAAEKPLGFYLAVFVYGSIWFLYESSNWISLLKETFKCLGNS